LINFAENKSYLTVFDGRRLIMDRELSLGLNNLLDILTKSLKIDKEQAMEMLTRYGFQTNKEDFNANGSGLHDQEIVDSIVEILKPYFSEVFDEVNKMLLFVKSETRGKRVEQIYLLGCIAHFPGADRFISEIFSLPAAIFDPMAQITVDDRRTKHFGLDGPVHIALSVGFAMRGMI
jgi:Tfp pilus assembly PilM family ATPase